MPAICISKRRDRLSKVSTAIWRQRCATCKLSSESRMCPTSVNGMNEPQGISDPSELSNSMPPVAPGSTILIVDDDSVVRSLMRSTLEDDGYLVIEAEDGLKACQYCEAAVPSLL